jgi:DNA-binding NarL/FixJ family response regulator
VTFSGYQSAMDHDVAAIPLRVVIADDDTDVRGALSEALVGDPRFRLVAVAADAREAIAACQQLRPDVAVLDVSMPGGGVAAARAIRTRSPQTTVVALSAHRDRATITAMLEAGAAAFLSKSGRFDLPGALLALRDG